MAFKRMKPARPAASAPIESVIIKELRRAEGLKERGRLDDALEIAESLHRKYPKHTEPLLFMMDAASESRDAIAFEDALDRLLEIAPDVPEYVLTQAKITAANDYAALALKQFKQFLERWPTHKEAPKVREIVPLIESDLAEMLDKAGIHHPDRFELAATNDALQLLIDRERYEDAVKLARQALEREPMYRPILNNMAMLMLLEAKWQEALPYSERVLEADPENVFALGTLARANEMLGYRTEAALYAKRMKTGKAIADKTGKILETLSYLGDDAGVLETYRQAQEDKGDSALEEPITHHLAGVAAMRLGQEDDARRYWKEALKLDPDFDLTKDNLTNLKQPLGERDTAWAYTLNYWAPLELLESLVMQIPMDAESSIHGLTEETSRTILTSHPWAEALVPILFERGDPRGRQFALLLASMLKTPAMLTAAQDFALSQYGPDHLRIDAANLAVKSGFMAEGRVRLWIRGNWKDVLLMGWELHDEMAGTHTSQVEKLLRDSFEAMRGGDGARSEKLLKKALEIEPDAKDVLNNLASTYALQGRQAEASTLLNEIAERFPDYFFSKVNMAQRYLMQGRLEDAEQILTSLSANKRLHYSEFAALAQAQVELHLKKHESEGAREWYDMWNDVYPDHPALPYYHEMFESPIRRRPVRTSRRARI
jgi:tetratricopeptide (TPR) repeat protein